MLHNGITGHMFNINMNWTYFKNILTGDKKVANFDTGNLSYIITQCEIFFILNSGDVNSKVTWWINFTDTLKQNKRLTNN